MDTTGNNIDDKDRMEKVHKMVASWPYESRRAFYGIFVEGKMGKKKLGKESKEALLWLLDRVNLED